MTFLRLQSFQMIKMYGLNSPPLTPKAVHMLGVFHTWMILFFVDLTITSLTQRTNCIFDDNHLAKVLKDAIGQPVNLCRPQDVPESRRSAVIRDMQAARHLKICSFNEFREFLGLKSKSLEVCEEPQLTLALRRISIVRRVEFRF
jgi:hypothetical protein